MHEPDPDLETPPGPGTRFSLAPGVRFEPLGDGTGILYSKNESLSLNHTGALLCSFADGQHTVQEVLQEVRHLFSGEAVDGSGLLEFLRNLEARRFLRWA